MPRGTMPDKERASAEWKPCSLSRPHTAEKLALVLSEVHAVLSVGHVDAMH